MRVNNLMQEKIGLPALLDEILIIEARTKFEPQGSRSHMLACMLSICFSYVLACFLEAKTNDNIRKPA